MKIKNLFWSKWKVTRTIWPYRDGWGTYRVNRLTGEKILLDSGLNSREDAVEIINELNKAKKGGGAT